MYYTLLLIIIIGVIAFLANQKKTAPSESTETSFELIHSVFTPAERSFYGVLKQVVGDEMEILAKVRVADVLMPQKGISKSAWQTAFNKISRKHFDFLLCKKSDLSVICGVELNDQSHKNKDRKDRDSFLLSACCSANLPLVMFNAQSNYSLVQIKEKLSAHISTLMVEQKAEVPPSTLIPNDIVMPAQQTEIKPEIKVCPKCSTELTKRVARKGVHAGKEFWACSAYPKCKHVEQINA